MNGLRMAGAGVALTACAALAGCEGMYLNGPEPGYTQEASPSGTSPTPEASSPSPSNIQSLLGHNASINLIYMEPEESVSSPDYDPKAVDATRRQLAAGSPALLTAVRAGFADATYRRYDPKSVIISRVSGKVAVGCITDDTIGQAQEDQEIQDAAAPYNNPNKVNIIVFDQGDCSGNQTVGDLGGFDVPGTDEDPIVLNPSFQSTDMFVGVTKHEVGHAAGPLDHAGTADCADPVKIEDCKLNPIDDDLSLMGYTESSSADAYTTPELYELGLLRNNEVQVVARAGEYVLHPMGANGLKMLKLTGANGEPVFITDESDPAAGYDTACQSDPGHGKDNDPIYSKPNLISVNQAGSKFFACFAVNKRALTDSVQVRTPEYTDDNPYGAQEFLAKVTRPSRIPNPFYPERESGVIKPGIVFSNGKLTVTLEKIASNDAVIKVTETAGA